MLRHHVFWQLSRMLKRKTICKQLGSVDASQDLTICECNQVPQVGSPPGIKVDQLHRSVPSNAKYLKMRKTFLSHA
jgi:hypothetical protein